MICVIIQSTAAGYDADAQAYFDEVVSRGGTVSDTMKQKISDGIVYLKGTGDWDLIDRLFIVKNSSAIAALTSIKNPTSTAATVVNSPTFTADVGYAFNGTTQYMNANFIPSSDGVNYTQNSAWFGRGIASNVDGAYVDMAVSDGTRTSLIEDPTGGTAYFAVNSGFTYVTAAVSTTNSHTHAIRTASNDIDGFKGGTQYNGTTVSNGLPTRTFYVAAYNNNGAANNLKPCTITWHGAGGAVNIANINTALDTYLLS